MSKQFNDLIKKWEESEERRILASGSNDPRISLEQRPKMVFSDQNDLDKKNDLDEGFQEGFNNAEIEDPINVEMEVIRDDFEENIDLLNIDEKISPENSLVGSEDLELTTLKLIRDREDFEEDEDLDKDLERSLDNDLDEDSRYTLKSKEDNDNNVNSFVFEGDDEKDNDPKIALNKKINESKPYNRNPPELGSMAEDANEHPKRKNKYGLPKPRPYG